MRLAEVEQQLKDAAGRSPLEGIAGRHDAAEVWERLSLGRKHAVLDTLFMVTVLPQRPGRTPDGSRFDPAAIDIQPKTSGDDDG